MKITKRELSEYIRGHMQAVGWDNHRLAEETGIPYDRIAAYTGARQMPRKVDQVIFVVREAVKKEIRRRRNDR